MKNITIIHGTPDKEEYESREFPSPSNSHWIPWLQKELNIKGYIAQAPEMPTPYDPSYEEYVSVMANFRIDTDTVLVGHSSGAGFIVR